jgi:hypothetical protein
MPSQVRNARILLVLFDQSFFITDPFFTNVQPAGAILGAV